MSDPLIALGEASAPLGPALCTGIEDLLLVRRHSAVLGSSKDEHLGIAESARRPSSQRFCRMTWPLWPACFGCGIGLAASGKTGTEIRSPGSAATHRKIDLLAEKGACP